MIFIIIIIIIIVVVVGLMIKWFLCVDEHDQETFVLFHIAILYTYKEEKFK